MLFGRTVRAPEQRDALDVRRVREHVDRCAANELVAVLVAQHREIGRERRRVARHVDEPLGRELEHPAAGDRAVDVVIAQLRAKIGGAGTIRTVRGAGYVIDPGTNPDTGAISGGQSPGRRSGRATISGATVPI